MPIRKESSWLGGAPPGGNWVPWCRVLLTEIAVVGIAFAPGFHAVAQTNEDAVAALRQLVQQQSRKIDELGEKVRELETREQQRDAATGEMRLPAIIIDTNGAPLGTLAPAEDSSAATGRPLPQISAGAGGFAFRSADTNYVLTLHGLVQADSRTFFKDNPLSQGNDGLVLRRARPIIEGTLFRNCDFLLTPDFGLSSVLLFDASVTYRFAPEFQLRAGKFKGPVSLEDLQTDAAAPLNEHSLASDLAPLRDLGIQLGGDVDVGAGILSWAAGIYDGDGDNRLAPNTPVNDDLEFGGRLFVEPFRREPSRWLQGLGFGVGGSYCEVNSNSAALPATLGGTQPGYLTTGQQQFFAYNPLLGPVVADGPHWRISPQGYYYAGPFGMQGEYVLSGQHVLNALTLQSAGLVHSGWQITGQWVLTGENASFNALTPAHSFDLHNGHWGAWQLVARYSELNLDPQVFNGFSDPTTSAQSAAAWTVGLNWWLNANVRWLVSFSHTTFRGGGEVNYYIPSTTVAPATVTHQDESVLFTRIQVAF